MSEEINQITQIIPRLFISSFLEAHKYRLLKSNNITHIINLSSFQNTFPDHFNYLRIQIDDSPNANINKWFCQTTAFIESALKNGGSVLVHCDAGVSRSVTIVVAFFIMFFEMPLEVALHTIRSKRRVANPNLGFIQQLAQLEKIFSYQ